MEERRQSEAAQAGILVWGKITASLAGVVAPLVIVRLIGRGEVGAIAGLMLVYTTLATVITAGLPRATLYFLSDRTREQRKAIVGDLVRLMTTAAVLMAAVLAVVGWLGGDLLAAIGEHIAGDSRVSDDDELRRSLRYLPILGLVALADLPTRLLPNILVAERKPGSAAAFGVIRSLVSTVVMVLPASLGMGVLGIVVAMAIGSLIPLAVFVRHLQRLYGDVIPPAAPVVTTGELVRYALPLGVTDIVNILNANVDMWLIVALFPADDVAVYRAGAYQIPIITAVAYSIGAVYLPRFATLHREDKHREAVDIWRNSVAKTSLLVVPASVVFFVGADEFIALAFTDEYAGAVPVFRCYCLLMMARVSAFGSFMIAAGRPSYVMRSAAFSLVANIAISVPLVLTVGFVGPALGTALAFVPTLAIYCYFIAKSWNVRMSETLPLRRYLEVVAVAAVPAGGAWLLKEALDWPPVVEFPLTAVVVLAGFAALGTATKLITREDWVFVWNWLRLKVLEG